MKRYIKEYVALIVQFFMFYIFPLFAGPTDAIGMVFLILLTTLLLSFLIGLLSRNRIKCLYPVVTAIVFIPSVFIYYNVTAWIHSAWYLAVSSIGLLIGSAINIILRKLKK